MVLRSAGNDNPETLPARSMVQAGGLERAAAPDPGLDQDLGLRPADDMKAVRFAEPVGARATESRGRGEHERAKRVVVESFEGVSFDGGALVDMASEDELRSRGRK